MRRRPRPLLLTALLLTTSLALAAAGCTVQGSGKAGKPAWKRYVHEHAVTSAPFTWRSGTTEVRVHAVVVEEGSTVLGKNRTWTNVLRATVVNRGAAPLPFRDLADDFRIRTQSGADTKGIVSTRGGWLDSANRIDPPSLPPGAAGEIRVQTAPHADGTTRDDPVAVSFRGQVVELR